MDLTPLRMLITRQSLVITLAAAGGFASPPARAQTFAEEVAQASYDAPIAPAEPPAALRSDAAPVNADALADQAAAAKQAEEIDIVRQLARQRGGQPAALAQIIQLSRSFNDAVAAEILDELAAAHLRAGDLNLAAEARRVLAEQYPGTPRAQDALLWLVRLYSSSEMVHARRQPSQGAVEMLRQIPANADLANARTNGAVKRELREQRQHRSTAANQPAAPYAIHLATQSMDRHPELADNAALAYQRAIAARLAGQQKQSQAFLSPLKHRRGGDPWGDCARMEAWLESGDDQRPPKPTALCVFADDQPQLDGLLNEPFWQLALPLPLKPHHAPAAGVKSDVVQARYEQPSSDSPTSAAPAASQVQLAYDRQYLYVAIVCEKPAGVVTAPGDGPRPRDADVEPHDHVTLRLDVDRDYASCFELLIDSRGWTADRCWGDAAWNPEWFVAAGELNGAANGHAWIVELAIPWSELTPTPPTRGNAWALSLVRTLPPAANQPSQSWRGPASASPGPESFGVLQFE